MNTPEQNSDLPTNVTNPRTLCMKFGPMIRRLLRNLHSDQKLIAEQVRSIRDLTPLDMLKAVKRGRRGWIDGIGSIFHEVFGVATDKQIATVEDHVKQIAGLFQSQTAVYKKSIHQLSSFNKDVNDRFANMAKAISDNALNIAESWHSLSDDLTNRQDFQTDLLRRFSDLNHATTALTNHQQSYITSMQSLANGRLPSYLLSAGRLREILRKISESLDHSPFSLIHTDTLWYYKHARFVYGHVEKQVFINIELPLTSFRNKFRVYELEKIQQLVPDQKSAKMILSEIPSGLVIQNNREFFYELSDAELIQVKLKEATKIESRVMKKVNSSICVIALFTDNREKIKEHCHYTIILDDLKSGIFWLSGNKFVITAQETYTVKCNDSEKIAICETQCVLFLDPGCSIETETEYVPAIFGNGTDVVQKYTVSANLLSHFFDSSDMALISGSSLF